MSISIIDIVESQVIASIMEPKYINKAISSSANIAFLLTGDLMSIKDHIEELKNANMIVFIHLDFVDGLSNSRRAIEYIAKILKPSGIITTKSNLIIYAKEYNLLTIQRIFLLDHSAVKKGIEMVNSSKPDAIEVLPGLMPRIIDELSKELSLPIIVGGLIDKEPEILDALKAGALAVSVSNPKLWNLPI